TSTGTFGPSNAAIHRVGSWRNQANDGPNNSRSHLARACDRAPSRLTGVRRLFRRLHCHDLGREARMNRWRRDGFRYKDSIRAAKWRSEIHHRLDNYESQPAAARSRFQPKRSRPSRFVWSSAIRERSSAARRLHLESARARSRDLVLAIRAQLPRTATKSSFGARETKRATPGSPSSETDPTTIFESSHQRRSRADRSPAAPH